MLIKKIFPVLFINLLLLSSVVFANPQSVLNKDIESSSGEKIRIMSNDKTSNIKWDSQFIDYNQFDDEKSTGISQLTQGVLNNIIIPFPPIEEQKEIIKQFEKLFAICDELEEQINSSKQNTQTLMQAVLKEAFEK